MALQEYLAESPGPAVKPRVIRQELYHTLQRVVIVDYVLARVEGHIEAVRSLELDLRELTVVEVAALARVEGVCRLREASAYLMCHDVVHDGLKMGWRHSNKGVVQVKKGRLGARLGESDRAIDVNRGVAERPVGCLERVPPNCRIRHTWCIGNRKHLGIVVIT